MWWFACLSTWVLGTSQAQQKREGKHGRKRLPLKTQRRHWLLHFWIYPVGILLFVQNPGLVSSLEVVSQITYTKLVYFCKTYRSRSQSSNPRSKSIYCLHSCGGVNVIYDPVMRGFGLYRSLKTSPKTKSGEQVLGTWLWNEHGGFSGN